MKSLLFLIILLSGLESYAQSSIDDKADFELLKGKLSLPVDRFCSLQTYDQVLERLRKDNSFFGCTPSKSLTIQSDSSMLVKSSARGKVISVFDVEGIYAVIIKHEKYFFTYINLNTVFVKKGDNIEPRQPLGEVLSSSYNKMYELDIFMKDEVGEDIDPYHWFINNQFL